jgi:hypothetical protein
MEMWRAAAPNEKDSRRHRLSDIKAARLSM